jgi:TatD DNase family protein
LPRLVDTHCHLDEVAFDADRAAVLDRAAAAGIACLVIPGVEPAQWGGLRALCREPGPVRRLFGVGTHPQALAHLIRSDSTHVDVSSFVPSTLEGAAAIGECGLDGRTRVSLDLQERILAAHVRLSRDADLPLILHCYKAHHRMLPLLRSLQPVRGVLHSYSGGSGLVDDYVRVGLHLSFGGPITWEGARKPVAALRAVPRERLLAETDAPDQCPRPWRGRSEPAFLGGIVDAMERLRGEPLTDALCDNARALGWG